MRAGGQFQVKASMQKSAFKSEVAERVVQVLCLLSIEAEELTSV